MLEIKCPGCGAGGRVPRDKRNNRLVCKKCLRVFHLSPSGVAMLGEPPERKDAPVEQPTRETSGMEVGSSLDEIVSSLGKIKVPKVSLRSAGITALVVLVAGLGYFVVAGKSLEASSREVADGIMKPEMKMVMDFSAPGTEMEVMTWLPEVIKKYGVLKLALGGHEAGVTVKVLSDGSKGPALVVVQFSTDTAQVRADPMISKSNTASTYEVHLYWVKNALGRWMLDGKRTIKDAP
jgi:hypothetical protein